MQSTAAAGRNGRDSAVATPQPAASGRTAVPPVEALRPSLPHILFHAVLYLVRNAVLCSLVAIFVTQPIYMQLLALPGVRTLGPVGIHVLIYAIVCHAIAWIVFNGAYALMDSILPETGHNPLLCLAVVLKIGKRLARCKLPRRASQQPSVRLVKKTVVSAQISNWIVMPMTTYVVLSRLDARTFPPRDRTIRGFGPADWQNPNYSRMLASFFVMATHFVIANVINEVGFYAVHGTLHANATLYRVFHKQHHEYTGTISIAAEYSGILEAILANTLPSLGYFIYAFFATNDNSGMFIQSARVGPLFVTWMWARLWETYETHSGFCFADTWVGRLGLLHGKRGRFHDFHHTHNVGNYGAGLFMDAIFGTMDPYLKHRFRIKQTALKND